MLIAYRRSKRRAESGQISAMLLALLPVLIGLAGLVVDGGIMFVHYQLGRVTIDDAAIAAASVLDETKFTYINAVELEPGNASATAMTYAAENGRGHVTVTGVTVSGAQVTVFGAVTAPTLFLRIFGVNDVTFNFNASAELKYGITEEGQ